MPKRRWGPFPALSEWIEANTSPEFQAAYLERLYAVQYHFQSLGMAARTCSTNFDSNYWRLQEKEGKHLIIVAFDAEHVVRAGDIAIREAASVIDSSLLVMNHVLALGLDARRVLWESKDKQRSTRNAIRQRLPAETKLVAAVDKVFKSIGYELLKGYRNWVTHRGAPKILYARNSVFPSFFTFEVPTSVVHEDDRRKQEWLLDRHVNERLREEFRVLCWPFVPQVEAVLSRQGPDPELIARGIVVPEGFVVRNARFTLGSLLDDAATFKTRNRVTLEGHRATVAGEELAVYSAVDYTAAVRYVELFIEMDVVCGEWDVELAVAVSRLLSTGERPGS